jgi:uncharacterized protein YndB with AHSA1/START domain
MAKSVQHSIRIRAKPSAVWATLIDPVKIARWMGGAHVESTWQHGGAISFTGTLHGRPYQDRGTVLACEPEQLLRYNHWSALSRLPVRQTRERSSRSGCRRTPTKQISRFATTISRAT